MDKILLMLQLQAQLNDATNGENWTKGVTKNGKEINWKRCIYMESAEMIDSFSWKHWKNITQEPDWANMQIEVVDVWHFIMSLAIEDYNRNMKGIIEDIALDISQLPTFSSIEITNKSFEKQNNVIVLVEDMMLNVLKKDEFDINELIEQFFKLVLMSGLDIESLYKLYVGKNILNQFRQDSGYKEGTYIKVWNGDEDNVIMQKVFKEQPDIKPDALYRELAKLYYELNK